MSIVEIQSLHTDDQTNNLSEFILSKFGSSTQEDDRNLCEVVRIIAHEIERQNFPLTPVSYFGAICSSLEGLLSRNDTPIKMVNGLLIFLSVVVHRMPVAITKKKRDYLSALIVRIVSSNDLSPAPLASCLKCITNVMIIADKSNWSELAQMFGFLLDFVADNRIKIRRQSHFCLRDILQSLGGTSLVDHASNEIANVFERVLLLASGSAPHSSEGAKGAQSTLYVLEALKECLPYMSLKAMTNIMKYYKSLLDLRQSFVTRRVVDCVNILCLHNSTKLPAEVLADLLYSFAKNISTRDESADSLTCVARVLNIGMRKLYCLDRQICVSKFPVVLKTLRDILASEHEEAHFAALEAFKSLIPGCIDDDLIKSGINHCSTTKSGETIIETVCKIVEDLLDYQYTALWNMSFQVVSKLFDQLGEDSFSLMKGCIRSLSDMQKLTEEDFPYRKELHNCIGSAVSAMGPESILSLLPFNFDADDMSETNLWLLPILKSYICGSRLEFFEKSLLGTIEALRRKSQKHKIEGHLFSSRSMDAVAHSLWSLFPSFCNYPLDTAKRFNDLAKLLCIALTEEPELRGIICSGLQILIEQNKRVLDGNDHFSDVKEGAPKERIVTYYTPEITAENLNVLRSSAYELLSVISENLLKSPKDSGGCLQYTIMQFASISDKILVKKLFKRTMLKLLKVTQEAGQGKQCGNDDAMKIEASPMKVSPSFMRARLFDLAVSFLPGLDIDETELLFVAVRPALSDEDGLVQKNAYKVLSIIMTTFTNFLSMKLQELLDLMIEVLPSCHFSAKRHRLDCLCLLIVHVFKEGSENDTRATMSSLLTEIILALKQVNKKTRNKAYDLLVQIGHVCEDEESGGNKQRLDNYFYMVAGGMGGATPRMVSATVKGVARLTYEFTDLISAAYRVFPSTFLLLERKNREIIKANLGFLKVLVAKSHAEGLRGHLKSMVDSLLIWQDSAKNHFKAKVKLLLGMLVKKCGLEAVRTAMPEEHMKLLKNIRKIEERKVRRRPGTSEEMKSVRSRATTTGVSRWNHTKIFSDLGNTETDDSDAEHTSKRKIIPDSRKKRKAATALEESFLDQSLSDDDPLDLLDRRKMRLVFGSHRKRKVVDSDEDEQAEFDAEGRLVIHEGKKPKKRESAECGSDGLSRGASGHKSIKASLLKKEQKRRKTSEKGWAYTGSKYANKRGGGDIKRKGKLEPYAYWPLDRKMMSRRPAHRAAARRGMASVLKLTKKFEGKSSASVLSSKALKVKKSKKRAR